MLEQVNFGRAVKIAELENVETFSKNATVVIFWSTDKFTALHVLKNAPNAL